MPPENDFDYSVGLQDEKYKKLGMQSALLIPSCSLAKETTIKLTTTGMFKHI